MRVNKYSARERLERVRSRARSARSALAVSRCGQHGQFAAVQTQPSATDVREWTDDYPARRAAARMPVAGDVSVRRLGGFGFQVPLRDVSAGGCSIDLVELVDIDDHVIARLPGLEPFGARVVWANARSAGLHFDRAMHSAVFELLLGRLI